MPNRTEDHTQVTPLFSDYVIDQWCEWRQQGKAPVLVTLLNIIGSAPRPPGAQMVVNSEGQAVGYLSGGCLERAIIDEAQAARAAGQSRVVRYGADSPYLDIQLPCGSTMELYFDVDFDSDLATAIETARAERREVQVAFSAGHPARMVNTGATADDEGLIRHYPPQPRLILFGAGPVVPLLAGMAKDCGYTVRAYSPDAATLDYCAPAVDYRQRLNHPGERIELPADSHTALVTLFHEHDWEMPVLREALQADYFYIGALGSRRTQENRRQTLLESGLASGLINRLHGPAGLFHSAKRPPDIAVSILAEVLAAAQKRQSRSVAA